MTMLLMLLIPQSFYDQMTIVLAADDHEHDSVAVLLPAGLVAKLLLKSYQLLCQPVLAVSCCFTSKTSTMQKPRVC